MRLTTSTVMAATALTHRASGAPSYPLSAHMIFTVPKASSSLMTSSLAPALSLTEAAVTTSASSQPSQSTARCRPRPVIFFPPW